jgi:SulP family sulfate permease
MDGSAPKVLRLATPSFADLFTPKLVTILREGYGWKALHADAIAGLTVAVVALPLSMAIAIGSGLSPEKGLYTAIVGGFLVSALGGSRFQIGGPAGAFIVLIAATVERHGYGGLVLATCMAGAMMLMLGFLRLGTYVKYLPFPVMVGFTAGIAVIIGASQLKELLGLDIAHEPAALVPKLRVISSNLQSTKAAAVLLALMAAALIIGLRRVRPKWPGFLIAIGVTAALTYTLQLEVATIGSRFGEVPRLLPLPRLPRIDLATMQAVLPDAIAIALLGSIESLLSAVVADGMTGRRHRSNCELVAQGVANTAAVTFGGMCVTGTIARTATNIRAGAHGPIAGMLHAGYVLSFLLIAAPLAAYIPLASLGVVLVLVAWNMAEKTSFAALLRSPADALVLLATFLLTIFEDLTIAVGVGVTLSAFFFLHRMAERVEVATGLPVTGEDRADSLGSARSAYDAEALDADVAVYRISGAFFFGAASAVGSVLDRIGEHPKAFVLDFSEVPLVDSTAANALEGFVRRLRKSGTCVYFTGADRSVRRMLIGAGLRRPLVRYGASVEGAVEAWRSTARS